MSVTSRNSSAQPEPDDTHRPGTDSATEAVPTVATKLRVPPTPRHLVLRKRLLDILDAGSGGGLILLSAPAGAGKTALLSSWIGTRGLPGRPCWLTLDADDNDASRLLADLLSALRDGGACASDSALEGLVAPSGARTGRFLPLLVNALAELRTPLVLVLDEVHELTSPQSAATLEFLVRHAPEQLRLVLAGRADPPLPIERLRVSGALTELRIADLAFDREETGALCRELDLALSDADVDSLWARTEGWAAALRLAGLSLQGHPEPQRFLAELSGTDRAVADYLVSEVLAHIAEDSREFMLRTCLVDSVNPELANALTGLDRGALMLAALEHSGAPLHPADADGHGSWYRFHPLFRELLRAHLTYARPEEIPFLHRRAAHWYADNGQTLAAIRHALCGRDWDHAGSLIAAHWLDLFLAGRSLAMRVPMAQLPDEVLAADARLAAAFAGSRLQDGDLDGAHRYLTLARQARDELGGPAREQLEVMLAVVSLHHARLRVRYADCEQLAAKLVALSRTGSHPQWAALRSFALANLGASLLWSGHPRRALGNLREALAIATEHRHEQIAVDCLAQLAIVHLLADELTRAEEYVGRSSELAEQRGWYDGPAAASAYLAGAAVAYRRGEFEHAEGLLSHASCAAETAEAPVRVATALLQALTLSSSGPQSAARGALKLRALRCAPELEEQLPDFLRIGLADVEARVLLAAEEHASARAALERAADEFAPCPQLLLCEAALDLHTGESERAAEALERLLDQAPPPRIATHLEAWLLRAQLEHAQGERRAAAQSLDNALALAEDEPFRDAFLLGGQAARELLASQAQAGTAHPALLEVLLVGVGEHRPTATLSEPLTEREQRILRYLPTMLSNAEIGAEVFVSLNTVKTHLRSIYRKLGANGRADAVEQARALGLLPSGIKRPRAGQRA